MLTPWVITVFTLLWLVGCGLLVWLAWRAGRRDAADQARAERPATPAGRDGRGEDDRAA